MKNYIEEIKLSTSVERAYALMEKYFPKGSKFIYNSKYGEKLERVVVGYSNITNFNLEKNNKVTVEFYIVDAKHRYAYKLEECEIFE